MNIKRLIAKFMVPKGERCNKVNGMCRYYTTDSYYDLYNRPYCKLMGTRDELLSTQSKICGINNS